MANWTFDLTMQSWTDFSTSPVTWLTSDGYPAWGCLHQANEGNGADIARTGQSIPAAIGDPISFWLKIIASGVGLAGTLTANMSVKESGISIGSATRQVVLPDQQPFEFTWIKTSGTITANGTIDEITLSITSSNEDMSYRILLDTIYVAEAEPAGPNARFYFALAGQQLTEKFTLPFTGVRPGAMTLDKTLGTVVIGSDEPTGEPVIYSGYPYPTGTAFYESYPTGTATQSMKWI